MAIKQISVFLENRAGALEGAVRVLAEAGVDMRAMAIADTQEFGILRLIVREHEAACAALREAGYILAVNDVTAVEIPDEPGGLARVVEILTAAGINMEYSYAFLTQSHGRACVVLRVYDNGKATSALAAAGVETLTSGESGQLPL